MRLPSGSRPSWVLLSARRRKNVRGAAEKRSKSTRVEPGPPSWDILTCPWLRARKERYLLTRLSERGIPWNTMVKDEETLYTGYTVHGVCAHVCNLAIDAIWINRSYPFLSFYALFPFSLSLRSSRLFLCVPICLSVSVSFHLFITLPLFLALSFSCTYNEQLMVIVINLYACRISRRTA